MSHHQPLRLIAATAFACASLVGCDTLFPPKAAPEPEPVAKAEPAPEPAPAPQVIETTAFVAPVLEGKEEAWKTFLEKYKPDSEARAAWDNARAGLGVKQETVYTQTTPMGSMVVVYQEGTELAGLMKRVVASDDAVNKEFQAMLKEVHGMDLTASTPPPAPSQKVVEYIGSEERHTPYAFAVPVMADKVTAHNELMTALAGDKADVFAATRKTAGYTREAIFNQQTPMGLFAVIVQEGPDVGSGMAKMAADESEGGQWLVAQIKEIYGVDLKGDKVMEPNTLAHHWMAK